ncbi:MAG TPA: ATPase, T2SS/T4P/T4SS family [Candidatus Obscuribacter sp.]|nr:ATPase, T2SS/T4P/T4SS family [Candidatus Obscuribacter sp.]
MSVSGNEIGDLLLDIGLITPEELETAHQEQCRSGERLTMVLEKLGLVSNNQLKDALELQFGVNYVSLSKHPPAREIVELLPEEIRLKHKVLPIAHNGNQYTIAMVNPDDLIAIDALKIQLKSGQLKKLVCTADDFEFVSQLMSAPAREAEPQTIAVVSEKPVKAPAKSVSPSKVPARKHLTSLFQDDDEDDLLEPLPTPAPPPANGKEAPPPEPEPEPEPTAEAAAEAVPEPEAEPDPAPKAIPSSDSDFLLKEQQIALEIPKTMEIMETVLSSVATHLVDIAPSLDQDPRRQLLEEVVESEFADLDNLDFMEPLAIQTEAQIKEAEALAKTEETLVEATEPLTLSEEAPIQEATEETAASLVAQMEEPEAPESTDAESVSQSEAPEAAAASEDMEVAAAEEKEEEILPQQAPAVAPSQVPAKAVQQPGEQLMSLARDIVTKAIQQKWSDIHLEPEQSAMSLRYFKSGEVLADCKLPIQINQPLAGSYKRMVGLDAAESKRPQDKKQSLNIAETDIELRVTTMPSEFGEMIAISIRYLT